MRRRHEASVAPCSTSAIRTWDPATGGELHTLTGQTNWVGDVVPCSPEAWRRLGWIAPSPQTGVRTRYPAEVFGPLPVRGAARRGDV